MSILGTIPHNYFGTITIKKIGETVHVACEYFEHTLDDLPKIDEMIAQRVKHFLADLTD